MPTTCQHLLIGDHQKTDGLVLRCQCQVVLGTAVFRYLVVEFFLLDGQVDQHGTSFTAHETADFTLSIPDHDVSEGMTLGKRVDHSLTSLGIG